MPFQGVEILEARMGSELVELSIIVCTKNNQRTLMSCLKAIFESKPENSEVIVVDGGSVDQTIEIIGAFPIDKVANDGGLGLAVARQIGFEVSSGDLVCYVDADVILTPNWFSAMLDVFRDPTVGQVHSLNACGNSENLVSRLDGYIREAWLTRYGGTWGRVPCIGTESTIFRRRAIEEAEGFRREFRHVAESMDLSWRISRRGWQVLLVRNARAYHVLRSTTGGVVRQQLNYGKGGYQMGPDYSNPLRIIVSALLSPLTGLRLSVKASIAYRDFSYLLLILFYPLERISYALGYFQGFTSGKRPDSS